MKKNNLYLYLFHYNPHTEYWNAFKKEDFVKYSNGTIDDKDVIKHKNLKVLTIYISKLD